MPSFTWLNSIQELTSKRLLLKRQSITDERKMPRRRRSNIGRRTRNAQLVHDRRLNMSGPKSPVVTSTSSRSEKAAYSCNAHESYIEKMQLSSDFSENTTIIPAHAIKKEIPDEATENEEFILPDLNPPATSMHPTNVEGREILGSYDKNQIFLLPNIKDEPTEIEQTIDEPFEGIVNSESENSIFCKYKLKKCYVKLHDCMLPKEMASTSSDFSYYETTPDFPELYPFTESPFFRHISDYKEITICKKTEDTSKKLTFKPVRVKPKKAFYKKVANIKKISCKPVPMIKNDKTKHTCNCFPVITAGNQTDENLSDSSQQLCTCLTTDLRLSKYTNPEELFVFEPDFGKIPCGINKLL